MEGPFNDGIDCLLDLGSVNAPPPLYTGTLAWAGQSFKQQASSLTGPVGFDRMNLERNNYGHNTIEKNSRRSGRDPETSKAGYAKV